MLARADTLREGDLVLGPKSGRRLRVVGSEPYDGDPAEWIVTARYETGLLTHWYSNPTDLIEVVENAVTAADLNNLAVQAMTLAMDLRDLALRVGGK